VEDLGSARVADGPRDTFGTLGFEGGFWILGILRFSASSMLELSRVFGGIGACSDLVNGVTSLNDGIAGGGLIVGWIVSTGGGAGEDGDFTGAWVFLGADVRGGMVDEGVFKASAGCKRLGRAMVGGAEGKRRLSINGD